MYIDRIREIVSPFRTGRLGLIRQLLEDTDMANTATVTGKTGPGVTVTALVFTNPRQVNFDLNAQQLSVMDSIGYVSTFDLHATATITATASSGVFTFTVSQ